jgi:XTP/dITP diphosphohydrolase
MLLVFATNNKHKLTEIGNLIGKNINLFSLADINLEDDIPEDEPTLEANALHKSRYIFGKTGYNVFADDTGLEVDALGGKPGVHSARFAGEEKNSDANIDKLLALLKDHTNRKARFRTIIALIYEGNEYLFEGFVNGMIIADKRGKEGFGYDPVFIPEGYNITFAEMPLQEKNKISHRAMAFEKLRVFLCGLPDPGQLEKE